MSNKTNIWPFAFYFMFFAGVAFSAPFTVLYYQSLGFSGTQIGLLTGLGPLITLFGAPLWTSLADASRRHRLIMSLTMLVAVVALFCIPFLKTFVPVLGLILLYTLFNAPASPFADSATMHMLGDKREMYGRIRMGGTIGFGIAAALAGILVQGYGLPVAFWGGAVAFFLAFLASQGLLYGQTQSLVSPLNGVRTLLASPRWGLFLLAAFGGGMAIAVTNNYLFSYLKELGADESLMGYALAAGTIIEVPVLFFGNRLIKRFKPYPLFILAMFITASRLLLFGAVALPGFVLFLQLLNGFTFPPMWMAGVAYAHESAPPGLSATAQGIFGAVVFGIGVAAGGFFGGVLLESVGGQMTFLIIGGIVFTIVLIAMLLGTRLPADLPKETVATSQ
jgi:MFS transporter, PPP family, 3-phenylpropionic acid transporter